MHHHSLTVTHQKTSADRHSRKLVEEVKEKHLIEWELQQLGQSIYLGHQVLVFELISSIPLHSFVETLGNRQQLHELFEPLDGFSVVLGDLGPSLLGRIV